MNQHDVAVYRARMRGELRKRMDDPADGLQKQVAVARCQAELWRAALRFDWAEQMEAALREYENDPTPANAETLLYVYRWCARAEAAEGEK